VIKGYASGGHFLDILWAFLLSLIFPGAYVLALTRKKLKPARAIFRLWFAGWVICSVLYVSERIFPLYRLIPPESYVFAIMTFLYIIFVLPTSYVFIEFFGVFCRFAPVYSPLSYILFAIWGAAIMVLLWTGIRGLKRMVKVGG
jgi:hypothetical protein